MKYITVVELDAPSSDGARRARFRVKWDGCRRKVAVNIGYNIDPAFWSAETCRCVARSFHGKRRVPASEINAEIARHEKAAQAAAADFTASPTVEEYRAALHRYLGRRSSFAEGTDVLSCLTAFIMSESARSGWSDNTRHSVSGLRAHLRGFQEARGSELRPDDFSTDVLSDFAAYLRGKGLKDSTVEKWFSVLFWFFNWCSKSGRMASADFRDFSLRIKPAASDVVFLDWDELQKVMNTELPKALERTRNAFLLQCFTGLRYSDLAALRTSDVSENAITLTTQKTADHLRIELNKYSRALLEKHKGDKNAKDRPLPVPPNQVMNRQLKEIGELCGITVPVHRTWYESGKRKDEILPKWKVLGTHAGRRTFVCLMLRLGVPATTVMQWTGHSDYKAMLPYIAVSDSAKAEAMSKLDSL